MSEMVIQGSDTYLISLFMRETVIQGSDTCLTSLFMSEMVIQGSAIDAEDDVIYLHSLVGRYSIGDNLQK